MTDNTTNKNETEALKKMNQFFTEGNQQVFTFFLSFATKSDVDAINKRIDDLKSDLEEKIKDLKDNVKMHFIILYSIMGVAFAAVISLLTVILNKIH